MNFYLMLMASLKDISEEFDIHSPDINSVSFQHHKNRVLNTLLWRYLKFGFSGSIFQRKVYFETAQTPKSTRQKGQMQTFKIIEYRLKKTIDRASKFIRPSLI